MEQQGNQGDLSDDEGIGDDDLLDIVEDDDGDFVLDDDLADVMEDLSVEGAAGGGDGIEDDDADEDDTVDDANVTFEKHTGSVFSVGVDPVNSLLAVSGGEDDKAYVWKLANGEVMFECTGHKDSVTHTGFSHDSKLVASGDMSGMIKVWNASTGQEVWSFECADLEWLDWHHAVNVLLAGTADGDTWMWKIPSGDTKTFQSHGCRSTCGMFMKDGARAIAGYEDGTLKVWDLKKGSNIFHLSDGTSHQGPLTCVDCNKDDVLIASGSEDSTVKLINSNTGKVLTSLNAGFPNPKDDTDSPPSIESVCFSKVNPVLATASLSGVLGLWDLSTQRLRQQCKHPNSIVKVRWDPSGPLLYSCCLDGVVRMWDSRSGTCEKEWCGHKGEILDFTLSRDGNVLLTGSGDTTARVYNLHSPER
ncbi:predicted protein [Nematostella vectensis]|uniref:Angio-associated migratory cell protein n=1 Tax=Nematostella vectensis TaxID=45351 RepID=A7SKP0_NEMVE|nr:predicted protein [Nematostella vectensis]|eukprot:XP_001647547.1 predicted protein [Nematostella vectensis]